MGQATSTTTEITSKSTSNQQPVAGVKSNYEFVNTQVYRPVNISPPINQPIYRPKYKAVFTSHDLLEAFKTFAIEGKYLNHTRFNDTIEKLFCRVDIPSMHYTLLAERIYALLDESKDGKISEEEFVIGMKNVFVNKDFRLKLSMMAMMMNPEERNFIEFKEICDFFFKSWVLGYKHLGWQVKREKNEWISKGLPAPTITQFELWANKFENHIRIYLTNDFRELGLDPNRPIDFETFKKWIYRGHNLTLTYISRTIVIATSLIGLDELGFDDSSSVNPNYNVNVNNPSTKLYSYPSFSK